VLLELAIRRPILGHFHGVYALGGLSGALIGGLLFDLDFTLFLEFCLFSATIFFPDILFGFSLYSFAEETEINNLTAAELHRSFSQTLSISMFPNKAAHSPNPHLIPDNSPPRSPVYPHQPHQVSSTFYSGIPTITPSFSRSNSSNVTGQNEESLLNVETPLLQEDHQHDPHHQEHDYVKEDKENLRSSIPKDYFSLIIISALGFIGYFGEGSIGDWSALYLTTHWDCSPLVATLGYVGFQLCVAIGRVFSDRIVLVLGRKPLLILSGIIAGIGLSIAVIASFLPKSLYSLLLAILGFACCGLGLSALSPTVISLAGSGINGFVPATALAIITAVGYTGILIGPPILGNFAEFTGSLSWSFLLDSCLIASISAVVLILPKKYHQLPPEMEY
jgi:MFS family permease